MWTHINKCVVGTTFETDGTQYVKFPHFKCLYTLLYPPYLLLVCPIYPHNTYMSHLPLYVFLLQFSAIMTLLHIYYSSVYAVLMMYPTPLHLCGCMHCIVIFPNRHFLLLEHVILLMCANCCCCDIIHLNVPSAILAYIHV